MDNQKKITSSNNSANINFDNISCGNDDNLIFSDNI